MAYQKSLASNDTSSVHFKEHHHHYEYGRNKIHSLPWFILTIFLAVVSMLCKEQGIVSLGVCFVYDCFIVCRINFSSIIASLRHISLMYRGKLDSKQMWASSVVWCVAYYLGFYFTFSIYRRLPTWVQSLMKRTFTLVFCTAAILFLRIFIIGRGSPSFVDSDNPASFSPHLPTRFLTYSYLCAVNLWLLFCPSRLCFDWSMGSIPLVDTLSDLRNLATVGGAFLVAFLSVFGKFIIWMYTGQDNAPVFGGQYLHSICSWGTTNMIAEGAAY